MIEVYLEEGRKRVFAGAVEWPGWCRSGRDESSALLALFEYGPRYARVLRSARLGFQPPAALSGLTVIERLQGNATTDFGAPEAVPSADRRPLGDPELKRFQALLKACWRALDKAARSAAGRRLRKGPRGGGRELDAIVRHVLESQGAYLGGLGWKLERGQELAGGQHRPALHALAAAAAGKIPSLGPRGGVRWGPRYFVRRAAWHVLDHAWEIEDRIS